MSPSGLMVIIPLVFIECTRANQPPSTANYIYVSTSKTWSSAESYCKSVYGTNLASIHSVQENNELKTLTSNLAWIGLNDKSSERGTSRTGWVWTDGSSFDYSDWYKTEPSNSGASDNSNEDCVEINFQSQWNDEDCTLAKPFICNRGKYSFPTTKPTPKPTYAPFTVPEAIPLLSRGYNLFKNELSGSNILDPDHLLDNTEYVSTAESFCEYSSLEFKSAFSSYESYATSDSESISISFGTRKFAAAGSYSQARLQARENARSSQSSIFSISLECVVMQASMNGIDQLHWNEDFINSLRILPRSYQSGNSFSDYINFWDDYGTHLLSTAKLGGSIHGSVVTDKCSVYESYGQSKEYEVCLNGAYRGVEIEKCKEGTFGKESLTESSIESVIKNKQIIVRGGDSSHFSDIFQNFGNKEIDFTDWINELPASPYIIGGNTNELHDVIRAAATAGGRRLVPGLNDVELFNIASAMEAAFNDYAAEIDEEVALFREMECSVDCMEGVLDEEMCICQDCKHECCPFQADSAVNKLSYYWLFCFIVFLLL